MSLEKISEAAMAKMPAKSGNNPTHVFGLKPVVGTRLLNIGNMVMLARTAVPTTVSSALTVRPKILATRTPSGLPALVERSGKTGGRLLGVDQSDLLHNLLGVEDAKIDQMLEATADSAAMMLGV